MVWKCDITAGKMESPRFIGESDVDKIKWSGWSKASSFSRPEWKDRVVALACSPDGRLLASLGIDGWVKLWDLPELALRAVLPEKLEAAGCLVFSPRFPTVAINQQGRIKLWDFQTGEVRTLGDYRPSIRSMAFSPDGPLLAAGGDDSRIEVWDFQSGTRQMAPLISHMAAVTALAFSPCGRTLASGSIDGTVKLWHVASQRHLLTLEGHSVAFSPDGTLLASGGQTPHGCGEVYLWRAPRKPSPIGGAK